jgi:hypothetical protein
MFRARLPVSVVFALCLGLFSIACNDDGRGEDGNGVGPGDGDDSGDGSGTEGGGSTGDGDGSGDGSGTGNGTSDGTGDGGDCFDGPGCYPDPNVAGAGLSSRAPLACGGQGAFTSSWHVDLAGGGAIDAAKSTPLATDFDGDGNVDILIAARKTSAPTIHAGLGDGTFGATTSLSGIGMFVGGWGLDAGDIDAGGGTDIAIGDHTEGPLAWLHAGGMSFNPATTGMPQGQTYSGCGLGDIDGDGDLDVVFGGDQFGGGYDVATFEGGSWTSISPAGLPPPGDSQNANVGGVQFFDYEGDGDMDMFAFGQPGTGGVACFVYENGGDGSSWTSRGTYAGGSIQSLGNPVQGAIGDVNCDDNIDIAAGGTVHLGDGQGGWTQGAVVDASDLSQLGDMNGDGWLDVVTNSSNGLKVYLGDGTGTSFALEQDNGLPTGDYAPPGMSPQGAFQFDAAYGIDLADLDNNENLDIVRSYKIRDDAVMGDSANENILEVWTR